MKINKKLAMPIVGLTALTAVSTAIIDKNKDKQVSDIENINYMSENPRTKGAEAMALFGLFGASAASKRKKAWKELEDKYHFRADAPYVGFGDLYNDFDEYLDCLKKDLEDKSVNKEYASYANEIIDYYKKEPDMHTDFSSAHLGRWYQQEDYILYKDLVKYAKAAVYPELVEENLDDRILHDREIIAKWLNF